MHVYEVQAISGTGSDAVVTLRNPLGSDYGPPIVQMKLDDLVGRGIPGLGPAAMVNIGQM
jgi:hypothetical protein